MRVWILTSEVPDEVPGGIARYVGNYAPLLARAGHEVVVVARTEKPRDECAAPGVRVIGFEAARAKPPDANPQAGIRSDARLYDLLSYEPALSYQMASEVLRLLEDMPPPDIIETQEFAGLPYFLIQRKLTESTPLENVPILVHLHSPSFELARVNQEPRYRFPSYWVGQMEKFCIAAADARLSPSRFLVRCLEQTLQHPLDAATIPYPVAVESPEPATPSKPREIVCVGRLQVLKGVLPLVEACARLWAKGEDFHLALIGGDTHFFPKDCTVGEHLRRRWGRWIEAGRLELAGRLPHAEAMARTREAWACVIPSLFDNFPNTCIEAMALGQLVLASASGGQAEMVGEDGVNGLLFDWDKPGDFEEKLLQALHLDGPARLRMARSAQARIRQFCSPDLIIPRRVRHYEQVIARYQPRRLFPAPQVLSAPAPAPEEVRPGGKPGLLSVVIPYYNLGGYVEEALRSALASTYSPMEILIANDGSTDPASVQVLREIEARGVPNVRILTTENQGLPRTRNSAAEAAAGEFLAFLDADDVVEPDFFDRALYVLRRYPNVDFCYSWLRYIGADASLWPAWNAEFPYLLAHNMVSVLCVVRRSSFLRHGRNKPVMAYSLEDHESWVSLVAAGGVGVSLPHALAGYRVRQDSMMRTASRDAFLYLHDLITQLHPEVYRQWGPELFNLQNANGPARFWSHPAAQMPEIVPEHVKLLEKTREDLWAEVHRMGRLLQDKNDELQQALKERDEWYGRAMAMGRSCGDHTTRIGRLLQERDRCYAEALELGRNLERQDKFLQQLHWECDYWRREAMRRAGTAEERKALARQAPPGLKGPKDAALAALRGLARRIKHFVAGP